MISPALEYLLARMDDLDELHRDDSAKAWADSELQPFVREAFAHIGSILKMQEIADRSRRHQALDLDALGSGVETARQLLKQPDQGSQVASGIDPNELLKNLEQNLQDLRKIKADPAAAMQTSALISRMDWAFMRAAVYLLAQREVPLALRDRVLEKIRFLPAADVALLWSWINQELQGEEGLAADVQQPTGFETFPDLESAKGADSRIHCH